MPVVERCGRAEAAVRDRAADDEPCAPAPSGLAKPCGHLAAVRLQQLAPRSGAVPLQRVRRRRRRLRALLRRLRRHRLRLEEVERLRRALRGLRLHLAEQRRRATASRSALPFASIDGPTRSVSKSKSSSCAVLPISAAAAAGSWTPASWITIWFVALLADLRLRDAEPVDAVLHDRDRPVEVVRRQLCGPSAATAFRTTSRPPWRSRPRTGFW